MKKALMVFLACLIAVSLTACGSNTVTTDTSENPETASETVSETASETINPETQTTAEDLNNSQEYISAVKAAYNEIISDEYYDPDSSLSAYMTDLNGDGYKDIVYATMWMPQVMIYENGGFVDCPIESDVILGSMFPSGKEGGYFIDQEKRIIVIRYDGHTTGTALEHGAEAFRISGHTAESLWIEQFDTESYYDDEQLDINSNEDIEKVQEAVNEKYDREQYNPRISDYNLVSFYDVCAPWDGSVLN